MKLKKKVVDKEVAYSPAQKQQKQIYEGGGLKPPEYMPTYYEWLKEHGEEIFDNFSLSTGGSYGIIYPVPANHTLFITSAYATANNDGIADGYVQVRGEGMGNGMILYFKVNTIGRIQSGQISFPLPLKIGGADNIIIRSDIHTAVNGGFNGFLVANHDIPVL